GARPRSSPPDLIRGSIFFGPSHAKRMDCRVKPGNDGGSCGAGGGNQGGRAEQIRMRDPYEVLGVPKTASSHDIKKAYRRLANKLHPDANKKDPRGAQKFAELNTAYEVIGDEDKRKAFDRGEIDAEGKARFHPGFEGAGAGRGFGGFGGDSRFESFT